MDTRRFSEGLEQASAALARLSRVTVPVYNRPLLVIVRRGRPAPERDPHTHCRCCGDAIPPGRAGRTCQECRPPAS